MIEEPEEYTCEHDSPSATFYYSDGGPQGDAEVPHAICSCGSDDTDGEFVAEWHASDAWRGHVEVKPAEGSRWVEVHDDGLLCGSEDERQLKAFDDFVRESLEAAGIAYVRAFGTSSNVFFNTYSLFVEKKFAKRVARLIREVKPKYRDEYRYFSTAITGRDPKDMEPTDHTFALLAAAILSGKK